MAAAVGSGWSATTTSWPPRCRRRAPRRELAFGDPTVFLEKLRTSRPSRRGAGDRRRLRHRVGGRHPRLQSAAPATRRSIEESASTVLDAGRGAGDPRRGRAAVRRRRLPQRRHRGVPGRPGDRQLPVHGGQHPAAGRASGDRGDHRRATWSSCSCTSRRAAGSTGTPPRSRGHAIEARLNAEDPEHGFAPAPGRLARCGCPTGSGIRVDAGVREGDRIPAEFDSMIAKIIAWGRDRDEALARLRRALGETTVGRRRRHDQPVLPA